MRTHLLPRVLSLPEGFGGGGGEGGGGLGGAGAGGVAGMFASAGAAGGWTAFSCAARAWSRLASDRTQRSVLIIALVYSSEHRPEKK